MPTKIRQSLIPITLIILLIIIVIYIFNDHQDPSPNLETPTQSKSESKSKSESTPTIASESDGESQEAVEVNAVQAHNETARRIRAVPDTPRNSNEFELKKDIDWENEFEAQDTLESALIGNIDDAIAVADLAEYCRAGYENETQIRSRLSQMANSAKQGQPIPGVLSQMTGETLQFKNFAEYEDFTLTRFAQCQSTKDLFNGSLRERLAEMAEAGNVNARYLYAMWNPIFADSSIDSAIGWMTYQSLAMDFTWRNIREGEPLGMLAYGVSLSQAGHVYFTPVHSRLGAAFIFAAYKCGLNNRMINQKVTLMNDFWKQRKMITLANDANNLSDTLVNTFCH